MSRRREFALAVTGTALWVAFVAGCGGSGSREQTAAAKPISSSNLVNGRPDNPAVYEHPNAAADAYTVVTPLGGDRYSLEVTNTNSKGFINKFTWFPGPGTHIVAVTSAHLQHGTGPARCRLVAGKINCDLALRPPTCTCRGDGGSVVIAFEARTPRTALGASKTFGGEMFIAAETLVPYFIPSSPDQKPSDLADLPICADGQKSTAAKPCLSGR